jgi:hypothetical protein
MPVLRLVDAERSARLGAYLRIHSASQKTRWKGPESRYEFHTSDRPCAQPLGWPYHVRAVCIPGGRGALPIGAEKPRNLRSSQRKTNT